MAHTRLIKLFGVVLLLAACTPASEESGPLPTLMELPTLTVTPAPTEAVVANPTINPVLTPTQTQEPPSESSTPVLAPAGDTATPFLPIGTSAAETPAPDFPAASENSGPPSIQSNEASSASVTFTGEVRADTSGVVLQYGASNALLVTEPEGEVIELVLPPGIAETVDGQKVEVSGTVLSSPDASIPIERTDRVVLSVTSIYEISQTGRIPILLPSRMPGTGDVPDRITVNADSTALQVYDTLVSSVGSVLSSLEWVYLRGDRDTGWTSGFYDSGEDKTVAYSVALDGSLTYVDETPSFSVDHLDQLVPLDRSKITIDSTQVLQIAAANGLDVEIATPILILLNRGDGPYWQIQSPLLETDMIIDAQTGQVK